MNWGLSLLSAGWLVLLYPRFEMVWLAPVALAPLVWALGRESSGWRRFWLGELCGIVYWTGVCYWIEFVLSYHGGMERWLAWFSFALFCVLKALHTAVFAALAGPLVRSPWAVVLVPALWVGIERLHAPFGFVWLMLGNAGSDMSVPMRLAPFTGVYGVSYVFAMMGTAVALLAMRRPRRQLAPMLGLLALFTLPELPKAEAGRESAAVVQSNVPQMAPQWNKEKVRLLRDQLGRLSLEAALDPGRPQPYLLLWPESPAPLYFHDDPEFEEQARRIARLTRTYFLFGTVAFNRKTNAPKNRALLLDPEGQPVTSYDKVHLVPFGEFVPPVFYWVSRITQEAGDFEPGEGVVVSPAGGRKLGTFICYESAFPEFVREFADGGAEVLINLTNDGYFGRTAARQQHLWLARMRAAENRRWVLRATNDGVTVSIDPAGRVVRQLPPFEAMGGRLPYSWIEDKTPYTRAGDVFAWGCLVIALAMSVRLLTELTESRS